MTFCAVWCNKFLTTDAKTIEDMIASLRAAADKLEAMAKDGLTLKGGQEDDFARLCTNSPSIARKYDMHSEEEDDPQDPEYGGEG